jgi:ribonuclease VapC
VIAVDTSALLAIALAEPDADSCMASLENEDRLLISAGTVAEALIVGGRRNVGEEVARLIGGLGIEVVPVTEAGARRTAEAYERWGRGVHPAGLNFGDCFAYEVAREFDCPLLYVGEDFALTDISRAI